MAPLLVPALLWLTNCDTAGDASEPLAETGFSLEPAEPLNRLARENSDYLRMHASNPVDWYPWGEEAFEKARAEDKPIFLSIGYASCHWCHVMEEESFADPETADLMNQWYVSIKVDREERPDVDAIYLRAIHLMGNNGGWPASLWLTPEGVPFYVGTYFPPEASRGRPGFKEVLTRMAGLWTNERKKVTDVAARVQEGLEARSAVHPLTEPPSNKTPARAVAQAWQGWDAENAGWGRRSKFPSTPDAQWLLGHALATDDKATATRLRELLDAMERLGLQDHVGGGFHRYCVDVRWTVPHFEKMLYDNAQLLRLYAEAAVAFDEPRYAAVARSTADWMLRDLRTKTGTFAAALDADDPGGEGAFYTWTPAELETILGSERAAAFATAYQVTAEGNFEHGRTVLRRMDGRWNDAALAADRKSLLAAREKRPWPATDTLEVVAWNGLAISGLARAGRLLGEPDLVAAAVTAADRVLASRTDDGALPRTLAPGSPPGIVDDYAFTAEGLLDLFEATGEVRFLVGADQLASAATKRFVDASSGALNLSEANRQDLIVTHRRYEAGAEPSGAGRLLMVLERLHSLGSTQSDPAVIDTALRTAGSWLESTPAQVPDFVAVIERQGQRGLDAVLATVGPEDPTLAPFLAIFDKAVHPYGTRVVTTPDQAAALETFPALAAKVPGPKGTRAYVCWDGVCKQPTDDPETFRAQLLAGP